MAGQPARTVLLGGMADRRIRPMGLEGAVRLGYRKSSPRSRTTRNGKPRSTPWSPNRTRRQSPQRRSVVELDSVIDPRDTRDWIVRGLRATPAPPSRIGKKRPQSILGERKGRRRATDFGAGVRSCPVARTHVLAGVPLHDVWHRSSSRTHRNHARRVSPRNERTIVHALAGRAHAAEHPVFRRGLFGWIAQRPRRRRRHIRGSADDGGSRDLPPPPGRKTGPFASSTGSTTSSSWS